MKFFLHLAYNGTNYRGWQRQAGVVSVQETIEEALGKMLKTPISVHGCGRTDAGVHASQYFAHVDLEKQYDFDLVERLNRILPEDIAVFEFIPVEPRANAQRGATSRTYDYYLHFDKNPHLSALSTYYNGPVLDLTAMNAAAEVMINHRDFRALCKAPDRVEHTRCLIMSSEVKNLERINGIRFTITASRFLKGMVRLTMNKLIKVGQGKMSVAEFDDFIGQKENPHFKVFAPPQGLYLSKVVYPFLERERVSGVVI
ncbi:MAG: tRNA pseudouridine(38-40) synthase TruA [Bacteroidetes bacterium]|nr:MAG: tRNA pseudouridine(38-40) synthase TruA [Bacteroidota bacterium]